MHNKIIQTLCENNFEVYLVGGAVRDILLGEKPKDYDVVTNATNQQIIDLFPNEKVDLVGANFQVVIVNGIEVATYRIDVYDKENNCKPAIATSLQEDLSRRDLTINSIAICPVTGDIIDLFNGRQHLEERVICFTGDPNKRIQEDPCRILRAYRFLAKFFLSIFDQDTFNALYNNRRKIKEIPKERIRLEIIKTMNYPFASRFFVSLSNANSLGNIFNTLCLMDIFQLSGGKYHAENVFDHCMVTGDSISTKFPLLKLTGYLHDIGKWFTQEKDGDNTTFYGHERVGAEVAEQELRRLKFSNDEIKYICNLIRFHMRSLRKITPKAMRRLISQLQENDVDYRDFLRLKIADRKSNFKKDNFTFSEIRRMVELFKIRVDNVKSAFSVKDLEIDGNDVMRILNISPCKTVGNVLKQLLEMVLDDPELNTREKLIELVDVIILNKIDEWHNNSSKLELCDYLGMGKDNYKSFVMGAR